MPEEKKAAETSKESPLEMIPSKELKVLYSWKSPSRPFKRRGKEFWSTVLAIVFLVCLILLFAKQFFLIAAIVSLSFLYYVLSTVEPGEIEHKITNKGLIFAGEYYPWEGISQFWFSKKHEQEMVNFQLREGLSGRITIVLGLAEEKKLKELLLKYLMEEEVPPNFLDKASDWLAKKIPLEPENEGKGKILSSSHQTEKK